MRETGVAPHRVEMESVVPVFPALPDAVVSLKHDGSLAEPGEGAGNGEAGRASSDDHYVRTLKVARIAGPEHEEKRGQNAVEDILHTVPPNQRCSGRLAIRTA